MGLGMSLLGRVSVPMAAAYRCLAKIKCYMRLGRFSEMANVSFEAVIAGHAPRKQPLQACS